MAKLISRSGRIQYTGLMAPPDWHLTEIVRDGENEPLAKTSGGLSAAACSRCSTRAMH